MRRRRLIKAWEAGEPQNPKEAELATAIDVLAKIGSAAAKRELKYLATHGNGVVRFRARQAIADPQSDADE